MTDRRGVLLVLAVALVAMAVGVQAQTPGGETAHGAMIPYSGRLTDGAGKPVADGAYDLSFVLYASEAGGEPLWSEVQEKVPVIEGSFTTLLGSVTPFLPGTLKGGGGWLAVGVRGPGEADFSTLAPRQRLNAVPPAAPAGPAATSACAHDHWGESWSGGSTTTGLTLSGGNTGLDSSGVSFGVYGKSTSAYGTGVAGWVNATNGSTYGVWGQSDSTSGTGVHGAAGAANGKTYGVYGQSSSMEGTGIYGTAPHTGTMGVATSTTSGIGVYGESKAAGGLGPLAAGVAGLASNTNGFWTAGVIGTSLSSAGFGVLGSGAIGVRGESITTDGYGVVGYTSAVSGATTGVFGQAESPTGTGVAGTAPTTGTVGIATSSSGTSYGVVGQAYSSAGRGVYGYASAASGTTTGVYGKADSTGGRGVVGVASASSGSTIGVYGRTYSSGGKAIYGVNSAGSGGYAGYFHGNVTVVGTLLKSYGGFKIDHPLDPANKYLYHSFVESPDMKNVYDGVVTLGADGTAWVQLPDWFEALNQDFRYQLTPIGAPGPNLYIAQEIADNRFQIAGGEPGMKVSWQVTGSRHDAYAEAHRIPVEEEKPPEERGTYLNPLEHGQPESTGLGYRQNEEW